MENPSPLEREINQIYTGMCRGFPSGWICWGYADGARPQSRLGGLTCCSWFNCSWWGNEKRSQGDRRRRASLFFRLRWTLKTALGSNRPVIFFLSSFYVHLSLHSRPDKCSATCREAKMAGRGGRDEGGGTGPRGRGGTDVGRLALGSGRELTNANYCAKLLAKYVSLCHIWLLRGRFMVRGNSVFLKGSVSN